MRNKSTDPAIRIQGYIPQSLYIQLQLNLPQDPFLGKPAHGAMSELLTHLISNWLDTLARHSNTISVQHEALDKGDNSAI